MLSVETKVIAYNFSQRRDPWSKWDSSLSHWHHCSDIQRWYIHSRSHTRGGIFLREYQMGSRSHHPPYAAYKKTFLWPIADHQKSRRSIFPVVSTYYFFARSLLLFFSGGLGRSVSWVTSSRIISTSFSTCCTSFSIRSSAILSFSRRDWKRRVIT